MPPRISRARTRKAAKWLSAAATALLLILWLGSGWYLVQWEFTPRWRLFADRGLLAVASATSYFGEPSTPTTERRGEWIVPDIAYRGGWFVEDPAPFELSWSFRAAPSGLTDLYDAPVSLWMIPIWPAVAAACLFTAATWHRDTRAHRRTRAGHCSNCNYNRAGLATESVCPECGTAPA